MAAKQVLKPANNALPVHRPHARLAWTVGAGLLLVSALGHGDIYRWKDSQGMTHYTQSPPAAADYQTLKGPPQPSQGARAASSRGDNGGQTPPPQAQPQQARADQAPKLSPEQRQQKCTSEQNRLASLERRPQVLLQYPDGHVKRLSEEERQAEIANTKNRVDHYCSD